MGDSYRLERIPVDSPTTSPEDMVTLQKYTATGDSPSVDKNGGFFKDNLRSSAVLDNTDLTEEKIKPEDNEPAFAPPPVSPGYAPPPESIGGGGICNRKIRTREIVLIVLGCVLLICVAVGTAVAIIVTQSESSSASTTLSPSTPSESSSASTTLSPSTPSEHISYDGKLQLETEWTGSIDELMTAFKKDMKNIINNTTLEEHFVRSQVSPIRDEKTAVGFTLYFGSGLLDIDVPSPTPGVRDKYGVYIEDELKKSAKKKKDSIDLAIIPDSIEIEENIPRTSTSSVQTTVSSSPSSTSSTSYATVQTTVSSSPSSTSSTSYATVQTTVSSSPSSTSSTSYATVQTTVSSSPSSTSSTSYATVQTTVSSSPSSTSSTSYATAKTTLSSVSSTSTTASTSVATAPSTTPFSHTCRELTFDLCRKVGYNSTYYPNMFTSQNETHARILFQQLALATVESECSYLSVFYYCGLFFPSCDETHGFLYPCQEVCEVVNRDCKENYRIKCEFYNNSKPCLSPPDHLTTTPAPTTIPTTTTAPTTTPTTTPISTCVASPPERCQNLGYNISFLPNFFKHLSMSDAEAGFAQFPNDILENNCSSLVTFYYCGLYFPECDDDNKPKYPCRSLCEELNQACGSRIMIFGCNVHDSFGSKCIEPPATTTTVSTTTTPPTTTPKPLPDSCHLVDYDLCNQVGINVTYLPNFFHHQTVKDALGYLKNFPDYILKAECSPLTSFYFCALHFPGCRPNGKGKTLCRSVCKDILTACTSSISLFDCDDANMFSDTDCLVPPPELYPTTVSSTTVTTTTVITTTPKPARCTDLTFSTCAALGYDATLFPNMFGDMVMDNAINNFHLYANSSIAGNCSVVAVDFFCAILFPKCDESEDFKVKFPCGSFCEIIMRDCSDLLLFPFDCSVMPSTPGECVPVPADKIQREIPPPVCVNQTFEMCRDKGFNYTHLPNWFAETLPGTITAFNKYAAATIEADCSYIAKFFYCGIFFPQCDDDGNVTLPCRSACEEMTRKCGSIWSFPFDCRVLLNDTDKCLSPPAPPPTTTVTVPTSTRNPDRCERTVYDICKVFGFNITYLPTGWGYTTQQQAFEAYEAYGERPVALGCSENAMFYFCTVLFPPCKDNKIQKPCMDVCEDINAQCLATGGDMFHQDCTVLADPNPDTCLRPAPKLACKSDDFPCFGTNKCISRHSVCDKYNDCGDWSDERNCPACNEFEFRCDMGYCIKSYERCNKVVDCPDLSDEFKCNCSNGQFTCPDGKCIMSEWVCDGENDCSNGQDEIDCGSCKRSEFACLSGECLPKNQQCDGQFQCKDHSDERNCIRPSSEESGFPLMLSFENEGWTPVCAEAFTDSLAQKACNKLGHPGFSKWTKLEFIGFAFAHLEESGQRTSVIGEATVKETCPASETVILTCNPKACGNPKEHIVSFIVNGNNVPPGTWPWQASIQRFQKHFCGASLISPHFVVTAAHCVDSVSISNLDILDVVVGATNVSAKEDTQQRFKVKDMIVHNHIFKVKNDIALLELDGTVEYNEMVRPVCLPDDDDVFTRTSQCYHAGWGRTGANKPHSQLLQEAKMTLWNSDKCNSSYAWNGVISDTHFCAGYYSGLISACTGDSGGPIMCQTSDDTWKLIGLASYVARGCNVPSKPSVFTDVRVFKDWIKDQIECKFRCRNGGCIFDREKICDRHDDCGDNSDEIDLCDISVNCTFDDKFLCGYKSEWVLRSETIRNNHYPLYDHTHGGYPGKFMIAKLRGKLLTSPRFTIITSHCASFYYHTRGLVGFGFQVYTHRFPDVGTDEWSVVFKRSQYKGQDNWIRGEFTLIPQTAEIVFMSNEGLLVAIDDFQMVPGTCAENDCPENMFSCNSGLVKQCIFSKSRCNMVADCDKGEDEEQCPGSSLMCDFGNGLLCGLEQSSEDDRFSEWKFKNDTKMARDLVDNTFKNSTGVMMILDTDHLLNERQVKMHHNLILPQPQSCLQFFYNSNTPGTFAIDFMRNGSSVSYHLWNITNRRTGGWSKTQVTIPVSGSVKLEYTMIGGEYDETYRPFIALDDLQITGGKCGPFECEQGLMPCVGENYCLPQNKFCDRIIDCTDASDEAGCECTDNEYKCPDGPCIDEVKKCDRKKDCLDGKDEAEVCDHLKSLSCDFEEKFLCGYSFNLTSYRWAPHKGETITPSTGPKSSDGQYIYADGTDGSAWDKTVLESQPIVSNGSGLTFSYHIYSSFHLIYKQQLGLANLTIVAQDNTNNAQTELFVGSVDGTLAWKRECVDLPVSQNLTVLFIAERGDREPADVALDNVKLLSDKCGTIDITEPTVPPTEIPVEEGCKPGERKCDVLGCAPKEFFCDGIQFDCSDNSDEKHC